eukprot:Unigene5273_Nuclearia_a/m.16194 Unigene5273_Nuclearia_a/g.16194  ORF Unigene5273_Nuclearia_a/g.16194 Unigene5273_Nuclearia_a/m.16194 type:complete len:517 (-) Unigene5273_Nuclearia_a:49-1599(-)
MPLTQLTTSFSDMALGLSSSERTSPTASPAPSSPSKPLKSALRRTASSPALKKPSPVGNTPATANTPRAPRVQFPPFVKAVNMRMFSPDEPAVLVNEVYRHRFMSDLTMPRPASVLATLCERQKIVLEDTSFTYPWLEGTVVVANLAYEKDVVVRMSFNNWLTFLDVPAEYAGKFKRRPDRDMDVFSFKIDLSPYFIDGRTLSVCFHVTYNRSETYWDNNSQRNYVTRMNEGVRMPATSRLNFSVPLPVRSPQSRPRSLADDMLGGSDELAPRRLEYVWTAENDNEDGSGEGGEGEEEEDDDDSADDDYRPQADAGASDVSGSEAEDDGDGEGRRPKRQLREQGAPDAAKQPRTDNSGGGETDEARKARLDRLWTEMNAPAADATAAAPRPAAHPPEPAAAAAATTVKVYRFAGQDVRVETPAEAASTAAPAAKAKAGGLDGLLSKFGGRKDKLNVVDKSKLDWQAYVRRENLAEELRHNNKDGYLERREFLERAEQRQYELERERRLSGNHTKKP